MHVLGRQNTALFFRDFAPLTAMITPFQVVQSNIALPKLSSSIHDIRGQKGTRALQRVLHT